jgi:hypothetical protein
MASAIGCRPDADTPGATIELTPVVALSGSGDTLDVLSYSDAPRSHSGVWYLATRVASTRGHVALFDSTGKAAEVFVGTGRGPGEVEVSPLGPLIEGIGFGPGDTILVGGRLGGLSSRVMLFSPPPHVRFIRSFDAQMVAFAVSDSGFVTHPSMTNPIFEPDFPRTDKSIRMVGVPPRAYAWNGTRLGTYGALSGNPDDRDVFGAMVPGDSGNIWFASYRRYEIDLVRRDGRRVRSITRNVDWFPEDTGKADWPWVKRPPTRIESLAVDDTVLWVLISRASRNWEQRRPRNPPALRPGMPIQQMIPYAYTDLHESVIEAFDVRTGRFLATKDLSGEFRRFNNAKQLIEVREDSAGLVTLALSRPVLRR